tara:strand:- start:1110 stop:1841 length:732 start_codon:yes stop_codon:yes gene_type:complete
MQKKRQIKVCLSPALFDLYSDRKSLIVVVDILRATSAMCAAFHNGVKTITPVSTVEEALEYKSKSDYIIAAERNGEKVSGFDYGNSPIQYVKSNIKDKNLVMTTTNGTRAINIAKKDHEVVIGSFLNITALVKWLNKQNKDIIILCAGWKDDFCLEDSLFAGILSQKLLDTKFFTCFNDSAYAAIELYINSKDDIFDFLSNSQHRKRLEHLKIISDIKFCLKNDVTDIIPVLKDDKLIIINKK